MQYVPKSSDQKSNILQQTAILLLLSIYFPGAWVCAVDGMSVTSWYNDRQITLTTVINNTICIELKRTRSSYVAEGPRDALCQLRSCQRLHSCTKTDILKRFAIREQPWKSLKVIGDGVIQWANGAIYHFTLEVRSSISLSFTVSEILQDITTFTVFVTACDLEKSSGFDTTVEITGRIRFLIHAKTCHSKSMLYFPRCGR